MGLKSLDLNFPVWSTDLMYFHCQIEIYVENHPRNRLEMSGNRKFDPKTLISDLFEKYHVSNFWRGDNFRRRAVRKTYQNPTKPKILLNTKQNLAKTKQSLSTA